MPLLILLIKTRLMITTRALKVAEPPCIVVLRARSSPSNYGICHMPSLTVSLCLLCLFDSLPDPLYTQDLWELTSCRSFSHAIPAPSFCFWVQSSVSKEPQLPLILYYILFHPFQHRADFLLDYFFVFLMLHLECEQRFGVFSICHSQKRNAWKVKWMSKQVAEQMPWLISVSKGNQHNSVQLRLLSTLKC